MSNKYKRIDAVIHNHPLVAKTGIVRLEYKLVSDNNAHLIPDYLWVVSHHTPDASITGQTLTPGSEQMFPSTIHGEVEAWDCWKVRARSDAPSETFSPKYSLTDLLQRKTREDFIREIYPITPISWENQPSGAMEMMLNCFKSFQNTATISEIHGSNAYPSLESDFLATCERFKAIGNFKTRGEHSIALGHHEITKVCIEQSKRILDCLTDLNNARTKSAKPAKKENT